MICFLLFLATAILVAKGADKLEFHQKCMKELINFEDCWSTSEDGIIDTLDDECAMKKATQCCRMEIVAEKDLDESDFVAEFDFDTKKCLYYKKTIVRKLKEALRLFAIY